MDRQAAGSQFKVFVGGVSWQLDDKALKREFEKFGAVDAQIMLDKMTGRSRGFGFVMFANRQDMDDAIAEKHDSEVNGRKISVRSAIPEDQIPAGERGRNRPAPRSHYGDRGGQDRQGYDRGGGYGYGSAGYERGGYEHAAYGGGYGGGYDRGYAGYSGGYGGGYSSGYGGGYDRDPYYGRDPYASAPHAYDSRGGYGGSGGYAGGPDRGSRSYGTSRSTPYDRPTGR